MTPETFNAQLATRKLEAADILLIQAKRGSDADRIRAASAILRIAFIPTPTRATDRLSSAGRCSTPKTSDPRPALDTPSPTGAPESPQQSEEIPGESPAASVSPHRPFPAQISAPLAPVCPRATVSTLVPVNSS
ncbi:MAG: hypothetical protein ACREJO_02340 [Phycisphaerales bacterium]